MNDDFTASMIGLAILAAIGLFGVFVIQPYRCASRFPDMDTRYGVFSGCLVQTKQGWIPEDRFRVL